VKPHVPLWDVGFTVLHPLTVGDESTGSFLSSDPPDPTPLGDGTTFHQVMTTKSVSRYFQVALGW
jgi:hypothetical protein